MLANAFANVHKMRTMKFCVYNGIEICRLFTLNSEHLLRFVKLIRIHIIPLSSDEILRPLPSSVFANITFGALITFVEFSKYGFFMNSSTVTFSNNVLS